MMLRKSRDRALFVAYSKAIEERVFDTQEEAIDFARRSPAPRFFIDSDFCNIVLGRMLRGVNTGISGYNTIRKFKCLFSLYMELKQQPKYSEHTLPELCDIIVEMPAPEFFVSNRTARSIISKERELKCKEYSK